MFPTSRQHYAPRSIQTPPGPSQTRPRSHFSRPSGRHVLKGNRDEEKPRRDLLCRMSQVRGLPNPSARPFSSSFTCMLDLRSSATSKSLVNRVRCVPPNSSPSASLDPPHKAERLRFFMSERSVLSSFSGSVSTIMNLPLPLPSR
jgi:hypothetical protein